MIIDSHLFVILKRGKASLYGKNKIFIFVLVMSEQLCVAMEDQSGQVCKKAMQVVVDAVAPLTDTLAPLAEYAPVVKEALPYAGVAAQVYWVSKDMKSYCFPNEQELAQAIEVDEQLFAIKTKKSLRTCFLNNSSTFDIEPSGYPTACKDLAETLVSCGKAVDVELMTAVFNQNRK